MLIAGFNLTKHIKKHGNRVDNYTVETAYNNFHTTYTISSLNPNIVVVENTHHYSKNNKVIIVHNTYLLKNSNSDWPKFRTLTSLKVGACTWGSTGPTTSTTFGLRHRTILIEKESLPSHHRLQFNPTKSPLRWSSQHPRLPYTQLQPGAFYTTLLPAHSVVTLATLPLIQRYQHHPR